MTTPSKDHSESISGHLVSQGLAACSQVLGPISSTYRWKGSVEKAEEWLCILKTHVGLFESLEKEVRIMHPYDIPEIVAVPLACCSRDYLEWLNESLAKER